MGSGNRVARNGLRVFAKVLVANDGTLFAEHGELHPLFVDGPHGREVRTDLDGGEPNGAIGLGVLSTGSPAGLAGHLAHRVRNQLAGH